MQKELPSGPEASADAKRSGGDATAPFAVTDDMLEIDAVRTDAAATDAVATGAAGTDAAATDAVAIRAATTRAATTVALPTVAVTTRAARTSAVTTSAAPADAIAGDEMDEVDQPDEPSASLFVWPPPDDELDDWHVIPLRAPEPPVPARAPIAPALPHTAAPAHTTPTHAATGSHTATPSQTATPSHTETPSRDAAQSLAAAPPVAPFAVDPAADVAPKRPVPSWLANHTRPRATRDAVIFDEETMDLRAPVLTPAGATGSSSGNTPAHAGIEAGAQDGASLDGASLDGASLDSASLDSASLDWASLDGAWPDAAGPDRGWLTEAWPTGASPEGASPDERSRQARSLEDDTMDLGVPFIARSPEEAGRVDIRALRTDTGRPTAPTATAAPTPTAQPIPHRDPPSRPQRPAPIAARSLDDAARIDVGTLVEHVASVASVTTRPESAGARAGAKPPSLEDTLRLVHPEPSPVAATSAVPQARSRDERSQSTPSSISAALPPTITAVAPSAGAVASRGAIAPPRRQTSAALPRESWDARVTYIDPQLATAQAALAPVAPSARIAASTAAPVAVAATASLAIATVPPVAAARQVRSERAARAASGDTLGRRILVVVLALLAVGQAAYIGARLLLAPASAVPPAVLIVDSQPSGADVFIDGQRRGETPFRADLPAGSHVLELRKNGRARSFPLTLAAGVQASQYVELNAAPGRVSRGGDTGADAPADVSSGTPAAGDGSATERGGAPSADDQSEDAPPPAGTTAAGSALGAGESPANDPRATGATSATDATSATGATGTAMAASAGTPGLPSSSGPSSSGTTSLGSTSTGATPTGSTSPGSTVPGSTVPGSTAPGSTAAGPTPLGSSQTGPTPTTPASPAPPAPTPAPPSRGWVVVDSPLTLTVLRNGEVLGNSDEGRLQLPPGRQELELRNSSVGYRATMTVQVPPGRETTLAVELPQSTITITATPSAIVWVDGREVGNAPITQLALPIGSHDVRFRHPEFGERRVTVLVRVGVTTQAAVDFTK